MLAQKEGRGALSLSLSLLLLLLFAGECAAVPSPDEVSAVCDITALLSSCGDCTEGCDVVCGSSSISSCNYADTEVTSINLYNRRLTVLPATIGDLTNLYTLNLEGNDLTVLPSEIGNLPRLRTIYLQGNELTALPSTIGSLSTLTYLNLYSSQLAELPESIGSLTSLTLLSVSSNQLTALPDVLDNLAALSYLNVGSNQLSALPGSFGSLAALSYLNLGSNQLTHFPEEIFTFTGLEILALDHNPLQEAIPESLGSLTLLRYLNLGSLSLTAAPASIGNLVSLTELNLASNQLTALPEMELFPNLTIFDLYNNNLAEIASSHFSTKPSLEWLRINYNQLTSLPETIGSLSQLTYLVANNNLFTALPASLASLSLLTTLHFDSCRLFNVPPLGNKSSLLSLNLAGNSITSMPTNFGNFESLRNLHLFDNDLLSLPEDFFDAMPSLTQATLYLNRFTTLPSSLGRATTIQNLQIYRNQLRELPESFSSLLSLTTVYLNNNFLNCTAIKNSSSFPDIIKNACDPARQLQCSGFNLENDCTQYTVCSWCKSTNKCLDVEDVGACPNCTSLPLVDCGSSTYNGCQWCSDAAYCSGVACSTCGGLDHDVCGVAASCKWCDAGYCTNSTDQCVSCDAIEQSYCNAASGFSACQWCSSLASCTATTVECEICSELEKDTCAPLPGCAWCQSEETCQNFGTSCLQCELLNAQACVSKAGCCFVDGVCTDKTGDSCPGTSSENLDGSHPGLSNAVFLALVIGVPALVVVAGIIALSVCLARRRRGDSKREDSIVLTEIEKFVSCTPETIDFSHNGLEPCRVGEVATCPFAMTNLTDKRFTVEFKPRPSHKWEMTFDPPTLTLEPHEENAPATCKLKLLCTTVMSGVGVPMLVQGNEIGQLWVSAEGALSAMLDRDEIVLERPLGSGSFATVHTATWRGTTVAVKVFREHLFNIQELAADVRREVDLCMNLRHPNIILYFGAAISKTTACIVMELATNGSLGDAIKEHKLTVAAKFRMAHDVASGMLFLHTSRIIHRDLKPDNVLLMSLDPNAPVCGKLSDFGTSRVIGSADDARTYTKGVGTPVFCAPEVLDGQKYSSAADVYSFSMLLWNMFSEIMPFSEVEGTFTMVRQVSDGKRPQMADNIPEEIRPLIEATWTQNPDERAKFDTIVPELKRIMAANGTLPAVLSAVH